MFKGKASNSKFQTIQGYTGRPSLKIVVIIIMMMTITIIIEGKRKGRGKEERVIERENFSVLMTVIPSWKQWSVYLKYQKNHLNTM